MDPIESVECNGFETSKCNSHVDDQVVSRKQKPAANGNLDNVEEQAGDVEDESYGAGAASQSNGYDEEWYDCHDEMAARNENLKVEETKSDLAKIDPSHLEASKVAIFVALAMILPSKPHALPMILPYLRKDRKFQGKGIIPIRIWMIAQASQDNLCVGLYSWASNLLPLVGSNPQSRHLILKFVEKLLLEPETRTRLVNAPVLKEMRLIPPPSFEILLRLTFPASSARVEATRRFEAIYPLLKEVALACAPKSEAMKQIFTFCLTLAGEGNPVLAKEATSIAIWSLTENFDCWKHWDNLYKENLKASVALLKKLVEKWKDHFLKLSSSPTDTLTLTQTMKIFKLKNKKAITEGGANGSLYKEADKSCKVISGRLSHGSSSLKSTSITAVVLVAAGAAAYYMFIICFEFFIMLEHRAVSRI